MNSTREQNFGGKTAVVVGGSMAGLLASRVLSDHFEKVILIERDTLPNEPGPRKGVPQTRHAHGLLKRGAIIIEDLFPGFFADLEKDGAVKADLCKEMAWFHFGLWMKRFEGSITGYSMTRFLLEYKLRSYVQKLPRVQIMQGCDMLGYLTTGDYSQVTGVQIRQGTDDKPVQSIEADLVVDASGRGSRTASWLESFGYPAVEQSTVKVNMSYASRVYRRPKNFKRDWKIMMVYPTPPKTRLGLIMDIEGDRWMVTLSGLFGDDAPLDEAGFMDFARSLESPDLYQAIKDAEPDGPIIGHKLPSNLRRRYEWMARFPDGLVVLGDALCSFNPIYGQGMTTSALDAMTLDTCLREQRQKVGAGNIMGLSKRFQKQVAKVIDAPWMMATGEDLRYPGAEAPVPLPTRLINWYTARVHVVASTNKLAALRFAEAMNMLKPPTALFDPRIVLRVLWVAATHRKPAAKPERQPELSAVPAK